MGKDTADAKRSQTSTPISSLTEPPISSQWPSDPTLQGMQEEENRFDNTSAWNDTFEGSTRNRYYIPRPPRIKIYQSASSAILLSISSLIFILSMLALLILSIQFRTYGRVNSVHNYTITYTIFTASLGILTFFIPPLYFMYIFFAFADGVITVIDTTACLYNALNFRSGYLAPCRVIQAISGLTWTSILFGCLHFYSMLYFNMYLRTMRRKFQVGGNGSNRGVFWTEGRVEIGLKYLKFSLRLLSHFVGVKDVVIGWVIGFVQAVRSRVIKRR